MESILQGIVGFTYSLAAFIIILVPLVVFHELGHFFFARLFGVKAEIFSVGFGPRLWARQWGETEFRVSAIPLGGYVKLLGEDGSTPISEEDLKKALHTQKPWKRFFIFLGGPLFNFILAIFIFMLMLMIGEPRMSSVAGRVVVDSPAFEAGFRSGDQIIKAGDQDLRLYEDLLVFLNENPGKTVDFTVKHRFPKEKEEVLRYEVARRAGFSIYGEPKEVGAIEGLHPLARETTLGVSNPQSLAGLAGLKTGDKIVSFNEDPIKNWELLSLRYQSLDPGESFSLKVMNKNDTATRTIEFAKPKNSVSLAQDLGLHSSELFVLETIKDSPAQEHGVLAGDRLVGVGEKDVESFFQLKDEVQKSGEKFKKVVLRVERDGKERSHIIVPTESEVRDPVLNVKQRYTVGVVPMLEMAEPEMRIERVWNPIELVYKATERMVTFSYRNLISVQKMFTGDVSMGSIGGPLTIGKIAGESMTRGFFVFLTNMAIFSIGLGILNILPVPVLDGGHLMLLSIEIVRGKPLTLRQMEIVQSVGLIFILALMGVAFHNDIARLIYS